MDPLTPYCHSGQIGRSLILKLKFFASAALTFVNLGDLMCSRKSMSEQIKTGENRENDAEEVGRVDSTIL